MATYDVLLRKNLDAEVAADEEYTDDAAAACSGLIAVPCLRNGGTAAYRELVDAPPPLAARGIGRSHRVGARAFEALPSSRRPCA